MMQSVDFKMSDVLDNLTLLHPTNLDTSIHEWYLALCVIHLTEIFYSLDMRFEADYKFDCSFVDETGVRYIRYNFFDEQKAMMVKIRGIGIA